MPVVLHTPETMQQQAAQWRRQGLRIGCVPTMGYLHEGHTSLIELAARHAEQVVVTIFVNPTQFGANEDLDRYPRDLEGDLAKCAAHGATAVFLPQAGDMYAPDASTWVNETTLSNGLCGQNRPGHFRGVTTIVCKLFWTVLPDVAVFGEKDAQQLRVIERMVRDLNIPVEIIRGPIVREADGLAMSSRNAYLSTENRQRALALSRALHAAQSAFAQGERCAETLARQVRSLIAAGVDLVDYVEVVDDATLVPVAGRISRPVLIAVAARLGETRLIDNVVLAP